MLHRKEILLLSLLWCISQAGLTAELSEQDYFSDLPEVLTVTRLAQPLRDTPGAVTIIDRDKIRRSGARDVTDVLRLVPGYLVAGMNGSHPSASYHVPLDSYGVRNLVLIDGRPAYNSFYLGDTNRSLMGLLLEDIERIEVLRGSNSAAYGANAMFGVINIITRHSADTHGGEIAHTNGDVGIRDTMVRVGWGHESASFRLSAGRQQDSGWKGAYDDKRIDRFHFRSDFRPASDQEVMLTLSVIDMDQQDGQGTPGDRFRMTNWKENALNFVWNKALDAGDALKFSASYDETRSVDNAPWRPDPTVILDYGGESRKTVLEFEHQVGLSPFLRMAWGAGYERNEVKSVPLMTRNEWIGSEEKRLFANLEWLPNEKWAINAGAYWNDHSKAGSYLSPRVMANFHVTPDHTLRIGASRSVRTPNLFELDADVRYYPKALVGLSGIPKLVATCRLAGFSYCSTYRYVLGNEKLKAERLDTQELGYFANIRELKMTLDVRGYVEKMADMAEPGLTAIPGYVVPPPGAPPDYPVGSNIPVATYVNGPGFLTRGVEYQLRWKLHPDTEIWLNQNFQKLIWNDKVDPDQRHSNMPPTHATTVAWFQKLPAGLDFSLMIHTMGAMTWGNDSGGKLPNRRRVDARLAWPFSIGSTKAELAVVTQAANGNYPEYLMDRGYEFERRTFGTLRIEF